MEDNFNIDDLIATQTGINMGKVESLRKGSPTTTAKVAKTESGPLLIDGHSKAYIAHEAGQKTINAEVVEDSSFGHALSRMVQDALGSDKPVKVTVLKPYAKK